MARRDRHVEVHKFGGASLADAAAFRRAIAIVRARRAPTVVVVSAPSGVTDALLDLARRAVGGHAAGAVAAADALRTRYLGLARALVPAAPRRALRARIGASFDELAALAWGLAAIGELTARTSDFVVSRGESLCAALFAAAAAAAGIRTDLIDAPDVIETDGRFGGASPDLSRCDRRIASRLGATLAAGRTPVLPGFLGAATGDGPGAARPVVTLGRGGTDLTATLVGRALRASAVHLWKDVPGLLTADPKLVPDARVIPQLHPREAAELAYYGAKVLHPRALVPLAGRAVPVFVRPFLDASSPGTEISRRRTPGSPHGFRTVRGGLGDFPVKALSAMPAQALVTVAGSGMLGVPGVAGRAFSALAAADVSVSLICQASSEHSICFTVPEGRAAAACTALRTAFRDEIARGEIDGVDARGGLSTVAVVGLGMAGRPGIAGRVFSALAAAGISVVAIAQGSSELNISFVVPARDAAGAQRAIHGAFDLAKLGGGTAERRRGTDLVFLGCGQIGRTLADLVRRGGRRTAGLRVAAVVDRSGHVFDPAGLSQRRLAALVDRKRRGHAIATAPGGHRGDAANAIGAIGRHALASPVLVDLTASETGPVLAAALAAGMDVVLANKKPLAGTRRADRALREIARAHGRRLRFEATVGAGLPILDTFDKLVESGDRVLRVDGCLSGTLGFVLGEVGHGRPFSAAVREAMRRGLTEPDPRDDLSGADVARKALILGRRLGFDGEPRDVAVESLVPAGDRRTTLAAWLRSLPRRDARWRRRLDTARRRGTALRYVARVTPRRIRVGLVACGPGSPFAALDGTDNKIAFTTLRYRPQPLVITGAGAGPAVTAGGLLNDILALANLSRA